MELVSISAQLITPKRMNCTLKMYLQYFTSNQPKECGKWLAWGGVWLQHQLAFYHQENVQGAEEQHPSCSRAHEAAV
jgi:hypothetical protein